MPETLWLIPHRIETERLVLRRYEASDAEEMSRVVTASRHYLSQWMPWARDEPLSRKQRAELISTFMREFDDGINFAMAVILRETDQYVGSTGFLTRLGEGILEIGYWIAADQQRNGYVTEAATALTHVGLDFAGAERVEIHHAPRNLHSRAIPERCSYSYDGRLETLIPGVPEVEPTDVWSATPEHLVREPLASTPRPRAFDAHGQELSWPA